MSNYKSIEKLYYEIALMINEELNDKRLISMSEYHKVEKELLKEKNK